MKHKTNRPHFATRAIHAGQRPDPSTGAVMTPIYATSTYVQESPGKHLGYEYSRTQNPTRGAYESCVADLENGSNGFAFASGMAAISTVLEILDSGDHVISMDDLYGGTYRLFENVRRRSSKLDFSFVDMTNPHSLIEKIKPSTKMIWIETPTNPLLRIVDLSAVSAIAKEHGLIAVCDNTFASPYIQRPLDHGIDIVVHSATKFIGGHGTSIGGVVIESGDFDWGSGRFPQMTEPSPGYNNLRFWENFGELAFCTKLRAEQLRDIGASLSPFNAFLLLQGLETLPQRMDEHVANARSVAQFLTGHDAVDWVAYAGLSDSPYYDLAQRYFPKGPGAVFTFGVADGREAAGRFIESLELVSHLANVGDARTLVIHPASTTHQQLSDEDLEAGGLTPEMVRLSVGLEDIEDILYDLAQALDRARV